MDLFHIVNRVSGTRITGFEKKVDAKAKRDELNTDENRVLNRQTKAQLPRYYIARGKDNT